MFTWQPTATVKMLKFRADILSKIRAFFAARDILEVDTPLLSKGAITDPNIISLETHIHGLGKDAEKYYLQTSPEFGMKRLLCAGSGSIYQICKAFRDDESGRRHNPEFTMVEWYRIGFDLNALMNEMDEFLATMIGAKKAERMSYREVFLRYCDVDPFTADIADLQRCAKQQGLTELYGLNDSERDPWLDLLLSHCIEPNLGYEQPTFLYDFPASQAALAQIRLGAIPMAERFEVYINAMELANGFYELADSTEQRRRFEQDLEKRQHLGIKAVTIDENFLAALNHGLPKCAGVAVGIDRLMMIAAGVSSLADVISFPVGRA
jgi:lysyl-tRNA synthetase class 2